MFRAHRDRRALAACAFAAAIAYGTGLHAQSQSQSPLQSPSQSTEATVTPLLTKALAGIEGKEVSMAVVEYGPGGSSPPHRHNANVFVYVLEGNVVMQVEGGEEVTLTAGQTFYESPDDIHAVSRNASDTEPAKILAFLVKEEGAPTTVPAD